VREQVAQYNRHQTQDEAPVHSTGHSIGFHPEDKPSWTGEQDTQRYVITRYKEAAPEENDDAFSVPQSHTSTRRYASSPTVAETRTVMRVTHHQAAPPIQRASRLIQQPARLQVQGRKRPRHSYKFVSVGSGMLLAFVLSVSLSNVSQWWQGQQQTMQYGYPRTFQCDANVKHGGISHFTVENLRGHILITEIQADTQRATVYTGPVFSGDGADLQPATIRFQDVNGDTYPDMIITVGASRFLLLNDHTGFRPTTPTDTITEGIN